MPALLQVEKCLGRSAALAQALRQRARVLSLGYEDRRRSRLRCRLLSGEEIALLLPRGTVLLDGDILVAVDGSMIRVVASAERLLEVRHDDAAVLQRVAYHLGNRHVPVQLGATRLRLAHDDVLAELARTLGASVASIDAPFEPESGAYGGGHKHGHADTFAEDDALAKESFAVHWSGEVQAELQARHQQHRPDAHGHTEHDHHHAGSGEHRHADNHDHDHDHDHDHNHEQDSR